MKTRLIAVEGTNEFRSMLYSLLRFRVKPFEREPTREVLGIGCCLFMAELSDEDLDALFDLLQENSPTPFVCADPSIIWHPNPCTP